VYGQQYISAGLAGLIASSSPALISAFSALLLGERFRPNRVLGLLMALVGVAVIVSRGDGGVLGVQDWRAAAVAVLTPLGWSAYTVLQQPLVTRHPPLGVVGTSMMVGSLTLLPLLPHAVADVAVLDAGQWLWLLFLGVGTTVVPYIIWFSALRWLSAGRLGMYMYLVPLTALGWSAALLGQLPSLISMVGGAAILAGVLLTRLPVWASSHARRKLELPHP
jgi:drug/metabolite transporter (DMT)-like permease